MLYPHSVNELGDHEYADVGNKDLGKLGNICMCQLGKDCDFVVYFSFISCCKVMLFNSNFTTSSPSSTHIK